MSKPLFIFNYDIHITVNFNFFYYSTNMCLKNDFSNKKNYDFVIICENN